MKTSKFLRHSTLIAFFAILLAPLTGFSSLHIFPVLFGAGMVKHVVMNQTGTVLFDGLAPEVWIPLVKEEFYPDNSFLTGAQDMSSLVLYDTINFAEAGADPNVMKNNTVYPIPVNVAGDTPKAITLDYYDTDSTLVRNAVAIELAYDQRQLYAKKHKLKLLKRIGQDAAWAYAPAATDAPTYNKVISLAGGDSMIDGIIDLQAFYNGIDDDGTDRHLVLNATHMAKIAKEDKVLFKAMMAEKGSMFYGFKIWNYSQNPIYIASSGVKAAQGAAFVAGTHKLASFAFLGSEVMKATGTVELFSKLKDPDQKGDIFNFQMRGLVSSLRGKYGGAILQ